MADRSGAPRSPARSAGVRSAADHQFPLAAGEDKSGVDVELTHGGAEITGTVVDVSGGPIAHAEVREATRGFEHAGAAAETNEQG